jgi:hypothetical protein
MARVATVSETTTALMGNGKGAPLAAGTYEVVEIDGVDGRAVYIEGPDGLCAIDQFDPNITIKEG